VKIKKSTGLWLMLWPFLTIFTHMLEPMKLWELTVLYTALIIGSKAFIGD